MKMTKYNYIKRQISKTNKKNDENYVVTRIWHKLNNENIKFITQQYVVREDEKYALTDMFFPQINLHIEIDEGYHNDPIQEEKDKIREMDIISITNHQVERIDVTKDLQSIHERIDQVIELINIKVKDKGDKFIPWDIEKEHSPETYIEKGEIDARDNVAFHLIYEAANLFGYNYKGYQRAATNHPYYDDVIIWFPKLYPNEDWENSINQDETIIREKNIDEIKNSAHIEDVINNHRPKRIVFARVKDPLGFIMYKFKGVYELDKANSLKEKCTYWRRISTIAKTYPNK